MTEPWSGARARPRSDPWHDRSARRHRHAAAARRHRHASARRGPRFGPTALAVGTVVGLVAGLGTGWAIDRLSPLPAAGSAVTAATTGAATPDVVGAPEVPEPGRTGLGLSTTGLDRAAQRQEFRDALPPEAFPTPPPPIDPDALDAAGLSLTDRQAGLLSTAVPTAAQGQLVVVPGTEPAPSPDRPVRTVRVEVEVGLEIDPALFARTVMSTLNDPRGWGADGSMSFARTDGEAEIRVVLASPTLVDALCAPLRTAGTVSCGRNGHAVLNHTRWVQATPGFADRARYREYLVNHEVGHLLGHSHVPCPGDGQVAPVMVQQSYPVASCRSNGWPFPDAG